MSDYISRQVAIDAFDGVKVDEENCTEYDIGYNDGIDFTVSKLSVLPSAELGTNLAEVGTDLINRRAAIDALSDYIHNVDKVIGTGKLSMDDCRDAAESIFEDLPSADVPDVIHCQECKYAQVADLNDEQDGYTCQFHRGSIWFSGCYCSWGERKTE